MKIEGIPDGWEPVRFDHASDGDAYLGGNGEILVHLSPRPTLAKRLIVRKVEKPKQYRPFANAAEFKPFRDRWWKKTCGDDRVYPPCYYNDSYSGGLHFDRCFIDRTFDDGTPFGIEVTE